MIVTIIVRLIPDDCLHFCFPQPLRQPMLFFSEERSGGPLANLTQPESGVQLILASSEISPESGNPHHLLCAENILPTNHLGQVLAGQRWGVGHREVRLIISHS